MDLTTYFDTAFFSWVILPILIILARIIDVSIGTLRIIFVARGMRYIAPILGFFEVFIWLLAIGQIMRHLDNFVCYIAYGVGFALGNYLGILIEERLAVGVVLVRIITQKDASLLIQTLRQDGYGVTSVEAEGANGRVHIVFTIIQRTFLQQVVAIIQKFNPTAFFTIEDVKSVREGVFPRPRSFISTSFMRAQRTRSKAK